MINHYSSVHLSLTSHPIKQVQYREILVGLVTYKIALTQIFLHVFASSVNQHSIRANLVCGQ
jgi:hypothetical protein